jgi:putative Mn2+ efflux pump MntP
MNPLAILVIALSMSVDAFAAALVKGATIDRPSLKEALRCGLIFGCVETVIPTLGWVAGHAAADFVQALDHWIALILLSGIGGKTIFESFHEKAAEKPKQHSLPVLIITAVGTSIDSLAVGIMVAVLDVNILTVAPFIGLSTFTMSTIGVLIGRTAGPRLGARAELVGGIGLVCLGIAIFVEHVTGA